MQADKHRHSRKEIAICLIAAGILVFFAGGKYTIAAAAWLAPLFLLRFQRNVRPWVGLSVSFLLWNAAFLVSFHGVIPLPHAIFAAVTPLFALYLLIPYLFDRLVATRIRGFASTLVFPFASIVNEYINSMFNPFGTWGSISYSQYGNLPLLQILQVAGIWGVVFVVSWFASALNWFWEQRKEWAVIRNPACIYGILMAAVFLYGQIAMFVQPTGAPTVRVASLTVPSPEFKRLNQIIEQGQMTPGDWNDARIVSHGLQDALLAKTEREAKSGAKIVFWSEANGEVIQGDEERFVQRGQELAKRLSIYLGMSVEVFKMNPNEKHENKLIWISPQGEIEDVYYKTVLIPGYEKEHYAEGDGAHRVSTPYGTIGLSICFDADFPSVARQNGMQGTDIQILPSGDWRDIDPLHTHMASFRAIENGYSLIRQTRDGLSAAYDPNGTVLATMDYYRTDDRVMISQVPTKGHRTLYALLGDWLVWISIAGLAGCLLAGFWKMRGRRTVNGQSV